MQTSDPMRLLRGFGLAAAALLLVSGAVFASQAGLSADPAADEDSSSATADASESPESSPSLGGVVAGEEVGTCMIARPRLPSRKAWLAVHEHPRGTLVVDEGARRALLRQDGSSLLPSGIVEVRGHFQAGDLVTVVDPSGHEIARGLVNYAAAETEAIRGEHSSRIAEVLGRPGVAEVIHRDDMVISADGQR